MYCINKSVWAFYLQHWYILFYFVSDYWWKNTKLIPRFYFPFCLYSGFCARPVGAPTFHSAQMKRSPPSGKTRWHPVFLLSQKTLMPIEGTTHQVQIYPSSSWRESCILAVYRSPNNINLELFTLELKHIFSANFLCKLENGI